MKKKEGSKAYILITALNLLPTFKYSNHLPMYVHLWPFSAKGTYKMWFVIYTYTIFVMLIT